MGDEPRQRRRIRLLPDQPLGEQTRHDRLELVVLVFAPDVHAGRQSAGSVRARERRSVMTSPSTTVGRSLRVDRERRLDTLPVAGASVNGSALGCEGVVEG